MKRSDIALNDSFLAKHDLPLLSDMLNNETPCPLPENPPTDIQSYVDWLANRHHMLKIERYRRALNNTEDCLEFEWILSFYGAYSSCITHALASLNVVPSVVEANDESNKVNVDATDKGMIPLDASINLGGFNAHVGVNTPDTYRQWLDMELKEKTRMRAKSIQPEGSLFEWVLAHIAVIEMNKALFLNSIKDN